MKTVNISLRAMEPEDLDVLYVVENDPELWTIGASNTPYSHFALKEFIANTTNDIYTDKQLRLVVDMDGEVAGLLDLMAFEPEHRRAEMGIVILERFRQKGVAQQAMKLLFEYCRSKLHLHQVYAWVPEDNIPSYKLFLSLGFHATVVKEWLFNGEVFKNAALMQLFL